jgi:hypothetical protein
MEIGNDPDFQKQEQSDQKRSDAENDFSQQCRYASEESFLISIETSFHKQSQDNPEQEEEGTAAGSHDENTVGCGKNRSGMNDHGDSG